MSTRFQKLRVYGRTLAVVAVKVVHPGESGQAVGCATHRHDRRIARMNIHTNGRLTPPGRLLLVQRVEGGGWGLAAAAIAAGISERQSYRWLARYRSGGVAALAARSSAPQSCKHRIGGGVGQAHRMVQLAFSLPLPRHAEQDGADRAQHAYRRLPTYRTASRPSSSPTVP